MVNLQVSNHLEQRAARNSPPGHGIRMQKCSNLMRSDVQMSHSIAEGGRVHRQTRSAAEGA